MEDKVEQDHHSFCNFSNRPRKGCKQCDQLYKDYPPEKLTPDELVKKHFPDVIVIKKGT